MAKLNDKSNDILEDRRKALKNQIAKEFSLVFMGDTHINMCGATNRNYYQKILGKVLGENALVAVVHGGDGVHSDNMNNMGIFKDTTENILFKPKKKQDKIPLFMNAGNHEYFGKNTKNGIKPIDNYNTLIGTAGQIQTYRLTPDSKNINVILEVILLDTGGPRADGFSTGKDSIFLNQIAAINTFIKNEISRFSKEGKFVRFIIDMHIPPAVGVLGKKPAKGHQPHFLREPFNKAFLKLLDQQNGNIVAVVTHHRHCRALKVKYKKIPIFITTHAGQCTMGNTRLEYIRLRLKPVKKTYQITNSKDTKFVINVQK